MKEDRVFIDLVKEGSVKASKDVQHIGIPCHWTRCLHISFFLSLSLSDRPFFPIGVLSSSPGEVG